MEATNMVKNIIYKHQGELDKLCGIYVAINATIKAFSGILEINHYYAQSFFSFIIDYLYEHKLLYKVMSEGSPVKRLKNYLTVLKDDMSEFDMDFEFPFDYRISHQDLIKQLRTLSCQPNTAIILSLEGKYRHWTLLDRITSDRIYLIDSAGLKYITIYKLSDLYDLPPDEICVVTVKPRSK